MPISIICLIGLSILLFSFNYLAGYQNTLLIACLLFAIGFLLYGPDSLLSGAAAVDFGTKKGASTASGFINGMGAIGAILGGALPGVIATRWGWEPLFYHAWDYDKSCNNSADTQMECFTKNSG